MKISIYIIYCCIVLTSCQSENKQEVQSATKPKPVVVEQKTIQDDKSETILNKRLKVFIPSGFALMDEVTLKARYPIEGRRPTEVYTNTEGTINIAFNHTQTRGGITDLPQFKQVFERQFNQPGINFRKSELKPINGTDFIILEFITSSPDGEVYNRMFITSLENRLLMGTFNCTVTHLQEWQPIADKIVNSLEVLK